ncbi:hypothetical protein BDA96_08G083700 [Sorghum bicolor]|uniref:Uncharacterized protein n=2 Tax=Sorghum bicolor TaxID=4558 RepID=A0A921QEV7_SORBI|nr:hypothetical protein BDA96_08G083700 [Sorghum bicolor]KXG23282.1 hypothetical protein SORBI_3008G078500 [Sorghum bicolor]
MIQRTNIRGCLFGPGSQAARGLVCLPECPPEPGSTVLKAPWSLATAKQNPVSFLPGTVHSIILSAIIT